MQHSSPGDDAAATAMHLPDLIKYGLAPMSGRNTMPALALDPRKDKTIIRQVVEALESHRISRLNFEGNRDFGDNAALTLACALKESKNNRLMHLNVAGTSIHRPGLLALADAVKSPGCKLAELNLGRVWLSNETGSAFADALNDPNCMISRLDLREARVGKGGLLDIVEALNPARPGVSGKLAHLVLEGVEDVDCEVRFALAGVLAKPGCSLIHLNLSHCYDFEDHTIAIADVLARSGLGELNLAYSEIGRATAIRLAAALEQDSCRIKRLDLRGNAMELEGPALFARALEKKSGLQVLFDR
jgi:hypothetical protein